LLIIEVILELKDRLVSFDNNDLAASASELLRHQKEEWQQCSRGYKSLDSVETKKFEFDGFNIYVQYNPGRITSTSAKVDPESVKERKCFLCPDNLPAEQKGILYKDYLLLCNPFPIFPKHFTIPSLEHKPQRILGALGDFLSLTKELSEKSLVFYNGPKCGASAPDHFHFQAGTKEFIPIVKEYAHYKNKFADVIFSSGNTEVLKLNDGLRRLIIIEGNSPDEINNMFLNLYEQLIKIQTDDEEPMMNIVNTFEDGVWKMIIILRDKHRPARFFEEGEKRMMISPAAVDIGGIFITPLEKDFHRITKEDIIEIIREVCISEERFGRVVRGHL
jgi:ATP adenylyltransferase/5',5'''-P-1,P-4-tetraphosphate phosphorylase II